MNLYEQVELALYDVIDPELNINIVDLGLIYGIGIDDKNNVSITMTLTTPGCPLHDSIISGVKNRVAKVKRVSNIEVDLIWEPAWNPTMISKRGKTILWGT